MNKLITNRKGLELSVNMIVMLIITILIFILAITMTYRWFRGAEVLKAEIDRQTEEQITVALRQGTSLIAIPLNLKTTKRGKAVTFGMGVRNVGAEKDFSAQISFSEAYNPDGTLISTNRDHVNREWLGRFATIDPFRLRKNEQKIIGLVVRPMEIAPGKPAPKGDYVFNICVYETPQPAQPCDLGQFKTVQGQGYYTNKMYQVTVRVD
jgi:hypothetical protein